MRARIAVIASVLATSTAHAQQPMGAAVIVSEPADAEIIIDGKSLGKAPAQAQLLPGEHLVQARWSDGKETSVTITIEAGASKVVKLVQAPEAPEPPKPEPPKPAVTTTTPSEPQAMQIDEPVRSPLHPRLQFRRGATLYAGPFCQFASADSNADEASAHHGCAPQLRIGIDWSRVGLHLGVLGLGVSEAMPMGFKLGIEVGTRYHQLGGPTGRVALAARLELDAFQMWNAVDDFSNGQMVTRDFSGIGAYVAFGLNLSVSSSHSRTIDVRIAGGFAFRIPTDSPTAPGGGIGGFIDILAGVRL